MGRYKLIIKAEGPYEIDRVFEKHLNILMEKHGYKRYASATDLDTMEREILYNRGGSDGEANIQGSSGQTEQNRGS